MCIRMWNSSGIKFSLHLSNIQTTGMPRINKPIRRLLRCTPKGIHQYSLVVAVFGGYMVSVYYSKCYFPTKIKDRSAMWSFSVVFRLYIESRNLFCYSVLACDLECLALLGKKQMKQE